MPIIFKLLPLDYLQPGQYQVRGCFEEKPLQELADSIASQGLIEPLIVRKLDDQRYEIVAGERRWRAAILASLDKVPCLIGDYSDEQAAAVTLIENIQRQNLNLIEEAQGYRRLAEEFHFQQEDIASLVGKSRSHIANILRLLTLCSSVQEKIRNGIFSLGHARMLVGLQPALQIDLAEQTEKNEWSVRQLEKKVKALKEEKSLQATPKKNYDVGRLEIKLSEQMGAPVQIVSDIEKGGWLQVKFFDNDTLAGLLDRMGLRYD